tara:strand:+ start:684 stop:917 length:234 start_codon:yes stop_codon:yes gene_type:complete
MPWSIFGSLSRHHGESVDPDLFERIKDLLDSVLGVGPWTIVAGLGVLILLMPLSVVVFYLAQRRRHPDPGAPDSDEP